MCSSVMWQVAPESLDSAIGNLWLRSQCPGQRTKAKSGQDLGERLLSRARGERLRPRCMEQTQKGRENSPPSPLFEYYRSSWCPPLLDGWGLALIRDAKMGTWHLEVERSCLWSPEIPASGLTVSPPFTANSTYLIHSILETIGTLLCLYCGWENLPPEK